MLQWKLETFIKLEADRMNCVVLLVSFDIGQHTSGHS